MKEDIYLFKILILLSIYFGMFEFQDLNHKVIMSGVIVFVLLADIIREKLGW